VKRPKIQINASRSTLDGFSEFWLTKRDRPGLIDGLADFLDYQEHHVDSRWSLHCVDSYNQMKYHS
jgi:hypothetical protein